MLLPVTLCTAAAMALITFWMVMRIGRLRVENKVLHGDGGHSLLSQRMRAQLNFVENAPFVLILIAAIEISGKGGVWLAVVAALFVIARVLHVFGMDKDYPAKPRTIGVLITVLTLLGLSVVAVLIATGIY